MRWLLPFSVLSLVATACTERGREAPATEPRVASSDQSVRATPAAPLASTAPAPPASSRNVSPASASVDVWSSREACERALATGARLPRPDDKVRVGTWNIRWFPDGKPGKRPAANGSGTDVAWLACAIAWLGVDALSVQEFKNTAWAQQQTQALLQKLSKHTGATWRLQLDDCDRRSSQHVGVLWRTDRLQAGKPLVLAELNPHGEACKDQLRPGLALPLTRGAGIDFILVSLHAKSGTKKRDLGLRRRSAAQLAAAIGKLDRERAERDVILAGDFNTMGCSSCNPRVSASEELAAFDQHLGTVARRVRTTPDCSHAYRGGAASLDHLVVRLDEAELHPSATAVSSGYCGLQGCVFKSSSGAAQERLSDHCPVLLDLNDVDADAPATGMPGGSSQD